MDFGKLTSQIPESTKDDLLKKASDALQEKFAGKSGDTQSASSETVASSDRDDTQQDSEVPMAVASTSEGDAVGSSADDVDDVDADSSDDIEKGAA